MKKAQHIFDQLGGYRLGYGCISLDDIEQIQLDAAKWAMTEATEELKKRCTFIDDGTVFWNNHSELEAYDSILTRRDNLTVKDMK